MIAKDLKPIPKYIIDKIKPYTKNDCTPLILPYLSTNNISWIFPH